MKRLAYAFPICLALLGGAEGEVLAAEANASYQPPSLKLKLNSRDAKRLKGDTLKVSRASAERYTYVLYSGERSVAKLDISSSRTKEGVRDVITCEFKGSKAQIWNSDRGKSGKKGRKRTVQRCSSLARTIGDIAQKTPRGSWSGPGSVAWTDPGTMEAGVSCKVATQGEYKGKCMCKCDHGWNPFGGLFCSSFYITMHIGGEGCHVGVGCEAPASACAN